MREGNDPMSRSACSCCVLIAALAFACGEPAPSGSVDVAVRVEHVGLDRNATPVVVLQEHDGPRWLPIWIGASQARSIAMTIENRADPRPNTHDLTRDVIEELEAEVVQVVVTELRGGTYYAVLSLRMRGRRIDLDSRPSDGIAIALRANAPIFVRAELFEEDRETGHAETPSTGRSI